jgi:hypothetical protein
MNLTRLVTVLAVGTLLAACESGDIQIAPVNNTDNSNQNNNNTTVTGTDPNAGCAAITVGDETITGVKDPDGNCEYTDVFAGPTNPILQDMTLPALPGGRAHKFRTSLFIGQTYKTQAELSAAGITQGGDGPTLTIEPGATLAFETRRDFLIVNRGSQIVARGTSRAPITFTSISDVENTLPTTPTDPTGARAVQQWGGIVINGFGVSNKCTYDGVRGEAGFGLAVGTECSIDAEGSEGDDESQYGGANDDDSSGVLEYVVVKHTGAQVANGDELNGISFGGVGRGTVIKNLQVYSTYDDGIEFFGGSADVDGFVALYVRDDSIDLDEGYNGTISNALVIQQENDGDHCIEADGIGSYSGYPDTPEGEAAKQALIAAGLNSRPVINNLTCIVSANDSGTHSDGSGLRLREGIWPTINNLVVITSFAPNEDATNGNYCLRIDNPETQQAALDGDLSINGAIFACQVPARGNGIGGFADEQAWAESVGVQFASIASGTAESPVEDGVFDSGVLELLGVTADGQPVVSVPWALDAEDEVDGMRVDNAPAIASTAPVEITVPQYQADGTPLDPLVTTPTYLGGEVVGRDFSEPWAFGINPNNRREPLWFE